MYVPLEAAGKNGPAAIVCYNSAGSTSADTYRSLSFPPESIAGGAFSVGGDQLFLSVGENVGDGISDSRIACYGAFDGFPLGCRVAGTLCGCDDCWGVCETEGLTVWDVWGTGVSEIFQVTLFNSVDDKLNLHVYTPPGGTKWTEQ